LLVALFVAVAAAAATAPLPPGQRHYTQSCGGCHGLLGVSARQDVPVLRDRVGYLLCSREGRDYMVRLPNIAFAAMDDATLASALNFMVFGLAGNSVPKRPELMRPFTAQELARLRSRPLKAQDLVALRRQALANADKNCTQTPDATPKQQGSQ